MPTPTTLTSYVPTFIARRLTSGSLIIAPQVQSLPAAVLCVEIAGLSATTDDAPADSEQLTGQLGTFFKDLTDLVVSHGGDIVRFAGDTLMIIWAAEATDEDLAAVTLRAARCGLAMNQFYNRRRATNSHLSLKLAIDAGPLLTSDFGGVYGRWEFLITGQPIAQVGAIARGARAGQLLLSPNAWTLVKDKCKGQPLAAGAVHLEAVNEGPPPCRTESPRLTSQAEAALRGYLPGALLSLLGPTQHSLTFDALRRVTILSINLPVFSYTTPPEETQKVIRLLQTILYDHEGSVDKISMDDRGTMLVAVLGLPPFAHEAEGASLGVQAALAMREVLGELNLPGAIGVTTGCVFCGVVGNEQRSEYTIIGGRINLAKKLMQKAPETYPTPTGVSILCDQATYQATQEQIAFDTLSPLLIEDQTEPIPVYRPTANLSPPPQDDSLPHSDQWLDSDLYDDANFFLSDS